MIEILIAFFLGGLVNRLYYAFSTVKGKTDWMNSSDWFKGKWWHIVHHGFCVCCPKKHYCSRYKEEYND